MASASKKNPIIAIFGMLLLAAVIVGIFVGCTSKEIKINFDTKGGGYVEYITVKPSGGKYKLPDNIAVPIKNGYTFGGWVDAEGHNASEINFDKEKSPYTLYATWTPVEYTLTYNLDGGVNDSGNPAKYTAEASVTLKAPTRSGYTFIGWVDAAGAAVTTIAKGSYGNKTLTAKWTNEYNVTYDLGGGVNNPLNPVKYDGQKEIVLAAPTRAGYVFAGWTGDGKIAQGATGDKSFTAKWEAIVYNITYSLGGGTNNSANPSSYKTGDPTLTIAAPTRAGYDFKGWAEGDKIESGTYGERVFTALWEEPIYNVAYVLNGGENSANNPTKYTSGREYALHDPFRYGYKFLGWKEGDKIAASASGNLTFTAEWKVIAYDITYILGDNSTNTGRYNVTEAVTLPVAIRPGYDFVGWTLPNGNPVTEIPVGSTGDRTFIAKWTLHLYTITYILGDNAKNNTSNPYRYTIFDDITLLDPSRVGYKFDGWEPAGVIPEGSYTDRTFIAKWTAVVYNISYVLGTGGVNDTYNPSTYTVDDSYILRAPTREHYIFRGWSPSATIAAGSTGDKSFVASWTPVVYNITYDLNGGTNAAANPSFYTIESAVITLADPTRIGYTFAGWTPAGTVAAGSTGDKSFAANWTGNIYAVTFDSQYGSEIAPNSANVTYGSGFTLPVPTRIGYTFGGWYTAEGGNGTQITSPEGISLAVWSSTETTARLYALWLGTNGLAYTQTLGQYQVSAGTVSSGIVYIPEWYNGKKVTIVASGAFEGKAITDVVFGHNIAYIQSSAFKGTSLISIKIPSAVTSLQANILADCANLTEIILSDTIIMASTSPFANCPSLGIIYYEGTTAAQWEAISGYYNIDLDGIYRYFYSATDPHSDNTHWRYVDGIPEVWDASHITITLDAQHGSSAASVGLVAGAFAGVYRMPVPTRYGYTFGGWYTEVGGNGTRITDATGLSVENMDLNGGDTVYSLWIGTTGLGYTAINDGAAYEVSYGAATATTVYIPECYNGKKVTAIAAEGFKEKNILSVEIGYEITEILTRAFYECTNLTSVNLRADGGALAKIGTWAFYKDNKITSVTIPNTVTVIDEYAFYYAGLTSIAIPNSVEKIANAAFGYNKLGSVTLPTNANFKTVSAGAFAGNAELSSIVIPSSVTKIEAAAFTGCTALSSVTLPSGLAQIGQEAFSLCPNLASIVIPTSVTSLGANLFDGCAALTLVFYAGTAKTAWNSIVSADTMSGSAAKVYIYSANAPTVVGDWWRYVETTPTPWTQTVGFTYDAQYGTVTPTSGTVTVGASGQTLPVPTRTGYTFDGWYTAPGGNGTRITDNTGAVIQANLVGLNTTGTTVYALWIGTTGLGYTLNAGNNDYSVSYGSATATAIYISEWYNGKKVTGLSNNAFWEKPITSVTIGYEVTSVGERALGRTSLASVAFPNNVESIGTSALRENASLTSVTFPTNANFKTISNTLFSRCPAIQSITIPASVTLIDSWAIELTNIKSITFESGSALEKINDHVFSNCKELLAIEIPRSVKEIGSNAFENCEKLASVTLPTNANYTDVAWQLFANCTDLKSIVIPEGVTQISSWCFEHSGLENITFPSTLTSVGLGIFKDTKFVSFTAPSTISNISEEMFAECANLAYVTLPDNIKSIDKKAFNNARNLVGIAMSNTLQTIGEQAFSDAKLRSLYLPNTVTQIDKWAFWSNPLTYVVMPASAAIKQEAFGNMLPINTVYYYGANETAWNSFKNALESGNDPIKNVSNLYYYSANTPTSIGNYWHYVGGIPTVYEIGTLSDLIPHALTYISGTRNGNNEGPHRLFDGSLNTKWVVLGGDLLSGDVKATVTFKTSAPVYATQYSLTLGNDNASYIRNATKWKLYGSSTNGNWTLIDYVEKEPNPIDERVLPMENYFTASYNINSPGTYEYYKLDILETYADIGVQLSKFELYTGHTGMKIVNEPWGNPTEDTTRLFNNNTRTKFLYQDADYRTKAVIFQTLSETSETLLYYTIVNGNDNRGRTRQAKEWRLYGANSNLAADAAGWTEIDYVNLTSTNWQNYGAQTFKIANPGAYRYYKLVFIDSFNNSNNMFGTGSGGGNEIQIGGLFFYSQTYVAAHYGYDVKGAIDHATAPVKATYVANGSNNTDVGSGGDEANLARLFDGDNGSKVGMYNGDAKFIAVADIGSSQILKKIGVYTGGDSVDWDRPLPRKILVEGSNNGSSWTMIEAFIEDGRDKMLDTTQYYFYLTNNNTAYRYYKFTVENGGGDGDGHASQIGEIVLYTPYTNPTVYLGYPKTVTNGESAWGDYYYNMSMQNDGRPISLGGTTVSNGTKFINGLSANANKSFEYAVPTGATRFVGLAGIDDAVWQNTGASGSASAKVIIYADGNKIFETTVMRRGQYWAINVEIPGGTQTLKIEFNDGGNGDITCDNVSLANAGFVN